MSSSGSSSRHSRRGGSQRNSASSGGAPATAREGERTICEPLKALLMEDPPATVAGKDQSALLPILRRLPTPGRGLASAPPAAKDAPEPWNASTTSGAGGAATSQTGGYRERLQAQGQQAMQRSLNTGGAGAAAPPPTASVVATHPGQACHPMATVSMVPSHAAIWGAAAQVQQMQQFQRWLGAAASMQAQFPQLQPPSPCGGPPTPTCGVPPPGGVMVACGPMPSSPTLVTCPAGSQMPQMPCTPVGGGSSATPLGGIARGEQTPQELLATVMPNAFCMDEAEIESQLVAAANSIESYDD